MQTVFSSLPDRDMVLQLIAENQLNYEPDFLNDPQSVNRYALEDAKAVNLGIYGSDLSIASSFDQTQESMIFLKCVNSLATQLGVSNAFDQKVVERIEANQNQKDSVIGIVTNAFKKVDEILKTNNRPATAAVILSGCWIEGLFVSCQIAQSANAESAIKAILGQKESLQNVIAMLESVKLNKEAEFILTGLQKLLVEFDSAESTTKYDKKAIAEISRSISELRNLCIKVA